MGCSERSCACKAAGGGASAIGIRATIPKSVERSGATWEVLVDNGCAGGGAEQLGPRHGARGDWGTSTGCCVWDGEEEVCGIDDDPSCPGMPTVT